MIILQKKIRNYNSTENDLTYQALLLQILRDSESCVCEERSCTNDSNKLHIERMDATNAREDECSESLIE
jgi:hypothetical protein